VSDKVPRRRKARRAARRQRRQGRRLGLPLGPGESVVLVARPSLFVTWPKYVLTLGLYGVWRKRETAVVTNRRILISRGVLSRSERSIPFDHIDDAMFVRRGFAGYTDVLLRRSNRVERIGPHHPNEARRLTSEILSHS
jgi:PH (Pleckstrin Homology) domain-containing protein